MFVTPPSGNPGERASEGKRKRVNSGPDSGNAREIVEESASPDLKRGKHGNMKRTPQLNMAQSRLTGSGGTLKIQGHPGSVPQVSAVSETQQNQECGVQTPAPQPVAVLEGSGVEPLTADFFRGLIGENTRQITQRIDAMSTEVAGLTKTVGNNEKKIREAADRIDGHDRALESHSGRLESLDARLSKLEEKASVGSAGAPLRNEAYLWARRSIRFWPIDLTNDETLWNGAGEFIHSALGIPTSEICQEDIQEVVPAPAPRFAAGNLNNEIIVTFHCPRKRDMVMSKVGVLASFIDAQGKPTAGVRLEVPPQLQDTFRLLSRFGARLRARHGEGTRRHIRFDDDECSLIANIKLPGDSSWSRVTVAMAKKDLEESTRLESQSILSRISKDPKSSAVPGPRQRLATPMVNGAPQDHSNGDPMQRPAAPHRPWKPRSGQQT